jgi:hypothetical protein
MVAPAEPGEPTASEESPASDRKIKASDRFLAILGLFVAILGLLAGLIALNYRVLILWTVLAAAIIIAFLPLFTPLRQWRYMTPVYSVLCAGLIIGFNQYIVSHHAGPASTAPVASSSIQISSPLPNASVPRCVPVSGVAKISAGDSIWILVEGMGPPMYYIEGQANTSSSQNSRYVSWNFPATIGSMQSSAGYNIVAIVLKQSASSYMQGMRNANTLKSNIGTLANTSLPPEILSKYTISVQRMATATGNCD